MTIKTDRELHELTMRVLHQMRISTLLTLVVRVFGTYRDDQGHTWIDAPGACKECCDGQREGLEPGTWGRGDHASCKNVPKLVLEAEENGLLGSMYHQGEWRWFVTSISERTISPAEGNVSQSLD